MTVAEAYKLPLRWDDGYVWTIDDHLAFQFMNNVISSNPAILSKESQRRIVDTINGYKSLESPFDRLKYNEEQAIIELFGKQLILIRGWGHLTGSGGLSLSEDEATRIQDDFARFIIDQLK